MAFGSYPPPIATRLNPGNNFDYRECLQTTHYLEFHHPVPANSTQPNSKYRYATTVVLTSKEVFLVHHISMKSDCDQSHKELVT